MHARACSCMRCWSNTAVHCNLPHPRHHVLQPPSVHASTLFHILLCCKWHEIIWGNNPSSWFAPTALLCPYESGFKLEWRMYWCYAGGALLHHTACNQLLHSCRFLSPGVESSDSACLRVLMTANQEFMSVCWVVSSWIKGQGSLLHQMIVKFSPLTSSLFLLTGLVLVKYFKILEKRVDFCLWPTGGVVSPIHGSVDALRKSSRIFSQTFPWKRLHYCINSFPTFRQQGGQSKPS